MTTSSFVNGEITFKLIWNLKKQSYQAYVFSKLR